VVDAAGAPVEGADVLIVGTTRRSLTGKDGTFVLPALAPGAVEVLVRKVGYRAVDGALFLNPGRRFDLQIALVPLNSLDRVTVTTQIFNEVRGFVTDASGRPLDSVQVSLAGNRRLLTGKDGQFIIPDIPPGRWMLRVSKRGYEPRMVGLQMVAQLERVLAVQLLPVDPTNAFAISDSVAWAEHERRRTWMGPGIAGGALVTREDLAPWGDQPLDLALRNASPSIMMVMQRPQGSGYRDGPVTLGGGVTQDGMSSGGACILLDGLQPLWNQGLQTFMASQVESVGIFPPNTDQTRSGCSRFPVASTCGCGASNEIPGYYVVWSRR
jgi:hypothetical protein